VKSENGFGSSSKVPGLGTGHTSSSHASPTAVAVGAAGAAVASAASAASAGSQSASHSSSSKSSRSVDGTNAAADVPSTGGSYLLIGLLILAGAITGVVAGGAVRRRGGS
jgi:hypothetical protein